MPKGVQFIFMAITDKGETVYIHHGFSDDFTASLGEFTVEVKKLYPDVVRIVADLALPPENLG